MKSIASSSSPTLAPGCNQVSVFSLNPANIFNQTVKTIATGEPPRGVRRSSQACLYGQAASTAGVAVVTNNSSNTVSVLDWSTPFRSRTLPGQPSV